MEGIRDAINYALSKITDSSTESEEMRLIFENVLSQTVNDEQVADRGGHLTDLIDLVVFG